MKIYYVEFCDNCPWSEWGIEVSHCTAKRKRRLNWNWTGPTKIPYWCSLPNAPNKPLGWKVERHLITKKGKE